MIAMAGHLEELNTRISELKADLAFVALAAQLRPRMGEVVQWQATGDALQLAQQFMNAKSSRPEGLYGPLLIRLLAAFERYLRMLIIQAVERQAAEVRTFDDLPKTLSNRNVVLTGRLLAAIDAPREHLTVDTDLLVANLASCRRGSGAFHLNAQAFSATVTGVGPTAIEKALENLDVKDWWDGVGGNATLADLLGTKGARATGDRAREKLKGLWRWRNNLAHGGDEEIAVSESDLRGAIDFVACFSSALDTVVKRKLKIR
jgi:hypothetical protein